MISVTDISPLIGAGGSAGLLVVIAGLLYRLLSQQNRDEERKELRIRALELDANWCNQKVSILIFTLQRNNIEVPEEIWNGPPKPQVADTASNRRSRRRNRDHDSGDSGDVLGQELD